MSSYNDNSESDNEYSESDDNLESNSDNNSESDNEDSESSDYADEDLGNEYYGMILDNRYIILQKIGSGGFASVWLSYYINDPKKISIFYGC